MAVADLDEHNPIFEWMDTRVENINDHVSAADVLTYNGVELKYGGDREEQISCPFHGEDRRPSARYFPDDGDSRSHVWCFACHERWDAIGLWVKYNGKETFSRSLKEIERAFGLVTPEAPKGRNFEKEEGAKESYNQFLEACENLLRRNRDQFDMESHLRLGHLVDMVVFAVSNNSLSYADGKERLEKIFHKISEKSRGA